jgi:hypothetical protein
VKQGLEFRRDDGSDAGYPAVDMSRCNSILQNSPSNLFIDLEGKLEAVVEQILKIPGTGNKKIV